TAFVYIRQSTPEQVRQNLESKRRQYALADRARALGWQEVVVLDEDLGRSGSGIARPGFERLLAAICQGTVGAVVSIEASRLARNGRDWHTLLEFCGLVGTLIVDENGVFDPRLPDDRLLLGMKGTLSEMELSTFRQRSREAIRQKARRGELFQRVAIGFQLGPGPRLEKNPDHRVQAAIELVFRKFREFGSVRQVLLWLRQERIEMPCFQHGVGIARVGWRLPGYQTIHHILTNPVYAGAYSYGRTTSRVRLENGRKRVIQGVRVARESWPVLLHDHHEGYIGWDEFEANQRTIADNANMKGAMARGAVRGGTALLAGLLRCGHCGRKLHVTYPGRSATARYHCAGANVNHGASSCRTSFGSVRVDRAVSEEVIRLLQPFGLAAALEAIAQQEQGASEKQRQCELALKQARYEVELARRQYDAVDPGNRLVAAELERRWNERLAIVAQREAELTAAGNERQSRALENERDELLALGRDVTALWHHPAASAAIKKRILRTVLREIVVTISSDKLRFLLHWQGGDHTMLETRKQKSGEHRWHTDVETERIITELARILPDGTIAAFLNRAGRRTAKGHTWTKTRICAFRSQRQIACYRDGERAERDELTLNEATALLGISTMTAIRLIKDKLLPARQACPGAPWVIARTDLDLPAVRAAAGGSRRPLPNDPCQQTMFVQ
ncbi:MAG: recombinase family protein, partial [Dyella sp.]|nr:recombinase family protein [Dyella sp.]